MELMDHQIEARDQLSSGKILWGGMGSGKSATALAYYVKEQAPKHIYIITTAKKRDSLDWEKEAASFGISGSVFIEDEEYTKHLGVLTVDSWNNVRNYVDIKDAFFIFDEQRVVGHGSWVKSFQKIAKNNDWILLSGTPGDNWLDYAPVFIANGFYQNITDFKRQHVLYESFVKFPKIRGYLGEHKLEMLRNHVLVEMPFKSHTEPMHNWLDVGHDKELFKRVYKDRWHVYEDRPIKDVAELFRVMRKVVNSHESRLEMIRKLLTCHDRLIIFYNFNYELDILRTLDRYLDIPVLEYNGHRKDSLPEQGRWIYLVQYVAGGEGWNCTTTDAMVLYSLTYSYKNYKQAMGRIDRLDTPYTILYYYLLVSDSIIDRGIKRALSLKRNFNERKFVSYLKMEVGVEG